LYQDTGFQGFTLAGVTILQPKKKPRGKELTPEEKEDNRLISKIRIRIEHAIGGVKRYRIVKDKIRNWKQGFRESHGNVLRITQFQVELQTLAL